MSINKQTGEESVVHMRKAVLFCHMERVETRFLNEKGWN